ncbi:MAG: hypothetical protein FJ252_01260 [Phycisphaerae bacterium]|nr:hypothetical protein [Phycisphaerae bacterium]
MPVHTSPMLVHASIVLVASSLAAHADFTEERGEREFSGELIVRPLQTLDAASRAAAVKRLAAWPARRNDRTDEWVIVVGAGPMVPGTAENAVAAELMATGLFQYACPNWTVYPCTEPNDPRFVEQWHHPMMQSAAAWDLHRADAAGGVIIAVTDTGIVTHEDLLNRVPGFNSASDLAEADGGVMDDINGHGTHVAGCAAAAGNNGVGVVGMGWNFRIMPIRVSEASSGGASYENLLQGVQWAAEHGAKVISTSYSGIGYDPIETTGQYVRSLGASMLWAAGNSATDHAGWDFPSVLVIGASSQSDQRASFSSFGRGVDLFAPGVSILSSIRDGTYGFASGTSMATPVANGALALIRSANPALTVAHAEHVLMHSCDVWGGTVNGEEFGWGRINLLRAVEQARSALLPAPPVARADRVRAIAGQPITVDVLANDFDPNMDPLRIEAFDAVTSTGRAVRLVPGTGSARDVLVIDDVGPAAGNQTLVYTMIEPVSGATSSEQVTIEVAVARPAVVVQGDQPGLDAAWYELTAPASLPDYSTLTPYGTAVVERINYASSIETFAGSGREDNVGATFNGWIKIPTNGYWTLGLTSDDGSRLWIDDDLVVNNDGLHGMLTVRGTRPLAAGKHRLRVEFFEAGGGAGLIMAWSGPGTTTTAIPSSALTRGGGFVPGDLDGDGVVNGSDLGALLSAWGSCTGCVADLNDDGIVDGQDLGSVLSAWAP